MSCIKCNKLHYFCQYPLNFGFLFDKRNSNITTELASTIKTFEDFRLVSQIRKELEKIKESLAITQSNQSYSFATKYCSSVTGSFPSWR